MFKNIPFLLLLIRLNLPLVETATPWRVQPCPSEHNRNPEFPWRAKPDCPENNYYTMRSTASTSTTPKLTTSIAPTTLATEQLKEIPIDAPFPFLCKEIPDKQDLVGRILCATLIVTFTLTLIFAFIRLFCFVKERHIPYGRGADSSGAPSKSSDRSSL
jgi:hypothetical protein